MLKTKFLSQYFSFAWEPPWLPSKLTWYQKSSDLIVTGGERIEHPAASHEKSPLSIVIHIRQRSETMGPETQSIQFGARNSVITHNPARCDEGQHHTEEGHHEQGDPTTSR